MCKYVFENGKKCEEEALKGSEFCALHTPFPEDRNSEEFKRLAELKKEKVKEKIIRRDFNFEGAILENIDFSGMEIKGDVNFKKAVILGNAIFNRAEIGGNASFEKTEIEGDASFEGAIIKGNVLFRGAEIKKDVWFWGAEVEADILLDKDTKINKDVVFMDAIIKGNISFDKATIKGRVSFIKAKIQGYVSFKKTIIKMYAMFDGAEMGWDALFDGAKIGGDASFNEAEIGRHASFDRAEIGGDASFDTLDIKGKLSFEKAIFYKPEAEENASRAARRTYEHLGDRETADRYFYREMVARRKGRTEKLRERIKKEQEENENLSAFVGKLKKVYWFAAEKREKVYQFFEWLFADLTCQYGTNPQRPVLIWLLFVIGIFPLIYYFGNGVVSSTAHSIKPLVSSEYFSIVTATTLGYGDLQPALRTVLYIPQFFRMVASFEAIFGTFMWVIFLTVFARKYMR